MRAYFVGPLPRFLVSSAVTLGMAASAAAGEGDDQHFSWRPSLAVATVYDDNPRFQHASLGPDASYASWIQPRVELHYTTPALELGADLGADARIDLSDSSLSEQFYRLSGFAELGLLPGISLRLSESYVPVPRQLGRPEDDTGNLVQSQRAALDLHYWRELSGSREIEVGVRGAYFTSDGFRAVIPAGGGGNVVDPNFQADFWEGAGYLEVQGPVSARESVFALGQAGYRDYSDSRRSAHTDASVQVGLRSRRFRGAQLELAGGYGLLAFQSGGDQHAFLGHATLDYQMPRGFRGLLSVANEFAANLAGNEVVQTIGRARLEKRLGERTGASAQGVLARYEDEAYGRQQSVYAGAEFQLWRDLTRHSRVELDYRYWWNDADETANAFRQNRVMLRFVLHR